MIVRVGGKVVADSQRMEEEPAKPLERWHSFATGSLFGGSLGMIESYSGKVTAIPVMARAVATTAGGGVFPDLIHKYLEIADYMAIAVIMFAGTVWLFGFRTRAIELLLGGTCGFLIILHAEDYVHWLRKAG